MYNLVLSVLSLILWWIEQAKKSEHNKVIMAITRAKS